MMSVGQLCRRVRPARCGAVLVAACLGLAGAARAQNLAPNPSFEVGTSAPAAWFLSGAGAWENFGRTGNRCLSLTGALSAGPLWSAASVAAPAGNAYVIRYWTCSSNATRGLPSGGFFGNRRDYSRPEGRWAAQSFAAWLPTGQSAALFMSVWDGNGKTYYDDVEVLPLNPVHRVSGGFELGAGETITAGRYEFKPAFDGYGGNFARPLHDANAAYNTDRWNLDPGTRVIYRHRLPGQSFTTAAITCGIRNFNSLTSTSLWVEVSTNGQNWHYTGSLTAGATNGTFAVGTNLLPAAELFVRLGSAANLLFAVSNYQFTAQLADTNLNALGDTDYFGQLLVPVNARILAVSNSPAGRWVTLAVTNNAPTNQTFTVMAEANLDGFVRERQTGLSLAPGADGQATLLLPTSGFGDNLVTVSVRDGAGGFLFKNDINVWVSILADDSFGELLPAPPNCPVWWCAGPYKVGRYRALPTETNSAAKISAARNEYEPFQLVLRPEDTLTNLTVSVGDFISATNGAITLAATNVTVCQVEYVNVTQLDRERFSATGEHPDPLVPLTGPLTVTPGTNWPFWFTVRVPKDAAAGDYTASVTFTLDGGSFSVPVQLRVFGFALTDVTHTRTAYGMGLQYAWHGLTNNVTLSQERAVWELYLQNLARHRISPYFPQMFAPVQWTYAASNQTFTLNTADFDEAMERFLEEYNFTSFKDLNANRELPILAGVSAFSSGATSISPAYRPLYVRLMQDVTQRWRERGWLDRAYSFWLDEPRASQMALVRDGNFMIEEAAPDHGRMQTEFNGPTPALNASVWVSHWNGVNLAEGLRRQAAGEQKWFYMATDPKAPAPNNFIDHPAINHRLRSWYTAKLNYDGELYYGVNYYLGTTNPWVNPMSADGALFGNGDGTLLYPPTKTKPAAPLIAGPFDSLRWELIRDGMEDLEYFWSLNRLLPLAEARLGTNHPAVLEARAARDAGLGLPPLSAEYPHKPVPLLAARDRLGAAIEALEDGAPFIAKEPLSKVARLGATERLRVEAAGWPLPTLQWQRDGTNLPAATNALLAFTNLTAELAGDYRVIASNPVGVVTSRVGRLSVLLSNQPPLIVSHPTGRTRTNGNRVVFGVGASSLTPLGYQWYSNGVALPSATNLTLILPNLTAASAGSYHVVVTNFSGATTSAPALLVMEGVVVSAPPVITSSPTNLNVAQGALAQFAVAVTGTAPFGYQWFFNQTNLLTGASNAQFTVTNVQPVSVGSYLVRVTNVAGAVTSAPAWLTLAGLPNYTNEPPGVAALRQGADLTLQLAPDNRPRWVLSSSNLLDWEPFQFAAPSAAQVNVLVPTTNVPGQFFRVQVVP